MAAPAAQRLFPLTTRFSSAKPALQQPVTPETVGTSGRWLSATRELDAGREMGLAEINEQAPCHAALLIIDMINDLEFDGGEALLPAARAAADTIDALAAAARASGVPVVYVNDNYGQWHSERSLIVEHCAREGARGREIVEKLAPEADDFFVIKPQFSGFYSTYLPALLPWLGARRLILTGVAADVCVLFTAADAHMREYEIWAPSDCVASSGAQRTGWALEIMNHSMKAEIRPTSELAIETWLSGRAP